jgi:hypothetical protein
LGSTAEIVEVKEGIKFRHFLSKEGVYYIISNIRKQKILKVNSDYLVTLIDKDGEYMGEKYLSEVKKLFEKGEWIQLN